MVCWAGVRRVERGKVRSIGWVSLSSSSSSRLGCCLERIEPIAWVMSIVTFC